MVTGTKTFSEVCLSMSCLFLFYPSPPKRSVLLHSTHCNVGVHLRRIHNAVIVHSSGLSLDPKTNECKINIMTYLNTSRTCVLLCKPFGGSLIENFTLRYMCTHNADDIFFQLAFQTLHDEQAYSKAKYFN